MLKSLRIQNLATIAEVDLELESGFSVLTGETGAGKSMIIEGIRLTLGEKGSSDVVRSGSSETRIEADFLVPHKGKGNDPSFVYIQRRIAPNGTGRGYLDGTPIPLKKLREMRDSFIDIYGQNDHVFLRVLDNQMDYVDSYAEAWEIRQKVKQRASECRKLFRRQQEIRKRAQERSRRQDFLRFQLEEIEKAQLQVGEEERLRRERTVLKNSEQIDLWVNSALELVHSQDQSVTSQLAQLQPLLARMGEFDADCKAAGESCESFQITMEELASHLVQFHESHSSSPEKLEALESRLSQIEQLKRKYGGDIAEILAFLERIRRELDELDHSEDKLKELDAELERQSADYRQLAASLRRKRTQAARRLENEIISEIGQLGMKKARFQIKLTPLESEPGGQDVWPEKGTESLEFFLSPNPGEDLKPLHRIASGGELSRFMLALKSVGKEKVEAKTLIFDEIDAGIGGKTAEFVARKLSSLAHYNQVICITHLPQIASFATHHFRIEKHVEKNRTFTGIQKLEPQERIEEIARLLAGSHITATTLQTAREMLEKNSPSPESS